MVGHAHKRVETILTSVLGADGSLVRDALLGRDRESWHRFEVGLSQTFGARQAQGHGSTSRNRT